MARSHHVVRLLVAWCGLAASAAAEIVSPIVSPPQVIGPILGPGATHAPPGVLVYGGDLGWTYEHQGELFILFGDTWDEARSVCGPEPLNDDSLATMSLAPPAGGPPTLEFATLAAPPLAFAPITVERAGTALTMGYGQVPLTGFSDGSDAFAIMGRFEYVHCRRRSPRGRASCPGYEHLECTERVGECRPTSTSRVPTLCDLASNTGCILGATCQPTDAGFCIDPRSSQNDGSARGVIASVAHDQEIGLQDPAHPNRYVSVGRFATAKFINLTSRTVACFTGRSCDGDYGPGHGALLVWGRAGFNAEEGRQSQLYLMAHRLPIPRDRSGQLRFRPRYFAGVQPESGEPLWTRRESRAAPLALDGVVGGSPHEVLPLGDQMAISWVGAPVNKWVMIYGGDLPAYLLIDPDNDRPGPSPGAVQMRFADHPWGPWTPPQPHLTLGSPTIVGDSYGPGGVLFHTQCVDQGPALCARSDPSRPADAVFAGCPEIGRTFDIGHFYGPNIIDAYSTPDGAGGVDVFWNVSTWNPYGSVLYRTNIKAAPSASAATCPPAGSAPHGGLPGATSRFAWCGGR